jgi:tetratricopeptide (TPR) repeat protein
MLLIGAAAQTDCFGSNAMKATKTVFPILLIAVFLGASQAKVKVWEEDLVLPSYRVNPPDPNPMFYRNESYQGAQKRIYPYALIDGVTGDKRAEPFKAVYLENNYVKLCVLPEIGGRLFYATDKTNGYEFFYRQQVMKPALIGMLGAWISGGIEWCVFHHHRNSTHMPVDYALQENADGSKTIWIGETERRHRMRWLIGMTLHPGRSFIEVKVKMINRTAQAHAILYWANVAVHANDAYQVIFPPSVQVATYHAKNDFVNWPIGRGRYQGTDYTGKDLSWWRTHPKAVSCFAWDLREDFMGGYDHGQDAGLVHIGNHHVVCGAKLWEWAPNNIWDTQVLTDADGPYAELMVGAYSDNQPDYSWIKPYEVKEFTQYWYPVQAIGGFKNANLNAAVNLERVDNNVKLGFHATSVLKDAQVLLSTAKKTLLKQTVTLAPDRPFAQELTVLGEIEDTDLKASLLSANGDLLLSYQPMERKPVEALPKTVKAPPKPDEIKTIEELYLTGLRVEQIYKPSIDPMIYYSAALKRDPNDVRSNTAVGIHYNRRGLYQEAETHLRRAVKRMTTDYTRPNDTESLYHLGLALRAQERWDEAYDLFYKASWDQAFHAAAFFQLASLSCRRNELAQALEQIDHSLATNTRNNRGKALKGAILRHLGKYRQAERLCQRVLAADPLDFYALNEFMLAQQQAGQQEAAHQSQRQLKARMRDDVQAYLELASDYMACAFHDEAIDILSRLDGAQGQGHALVAYYLGYLHQQKNMHDRARAYYAQAATRPYDYCFPFRQESARILRAVIADQPRDARAHYYLGNLLYDSQPDRAIALWEKARSLDPSLGVVHRNLGWGYQRHKGQVDAAIVSYEKAISQHADDPRFYLELDDLYERANREPAQRLAMLDKNPAIVSQRKDLLIRRISLLIQNAKYDQAIQLLSDNRFFISEGGGRELGDAYVDALVLRGLLRFKKGQAQAALKDFQAAGQYPENLSQESVRNERRMAQIQFSLARAWHGLRDTARTRQAYEDVINLEARRNSQAARFYQALAYQALGQEGEAKDIGDELVSAATRRIQGEGDIDFFAKFGEQATRQTQRADARYLLGLGLLLQGKNAEAKNQFDQAVNYNKGHVWARYQLSCLP